jgi:hypothetical protein
MWKPLFVLAFAVSAAIGHCSIAMAQDAAAMLESYQEEYAQIQQQVASCEAEENSLTQRRAIAAMNGYLIPDAACMGSMPAWISRGAFLEAQIQRLQTGDYTSTPCQLNGIAIGCNDDRR